ncbi:FG-GAP repeat domain-containing protein [Sandaracinus amylolyticus]|uniref:FG-GAP repeat domain-containing protein n=1 Tax=Sandaracinus amylolyticus TaxID=927083 RepID=UPI001F47BC65|nr:VCBS repeat-containing protein [Sandaracinus amylolyticus]UJR80875.1 Hypothetical protein I5071_29250 [Sandaracinus amylolyticus]
MKAVRATLQTLAVLLGLWVVLAVVGLVAGVLPIPGLGGGATSETPAESADAGVAEVDAASEVDAAALDVDASVATDAGPPVPEVPRFRRDRWIVCPEPAIAPSLAAIDLIGDAHAELAVGCGDRWEIIAIQNDLPVRVARVDAPASDAESAPMAGAALAADFDADGARDLVLPLAFYGAGSATRGGGLYVVPRDRFGGFENPRVLAPIAAVGVVAGLVDEGDAIDLAVVHRANPFARLPSEVWVFAGGASPARRAVLRTAVGAQSAGLVDLDRDGKLDVIVTSPDEGRADVFFGSGTGPFPRHHTLTIPGASGVAIGDVDGDGANDALIEASGIVLVRARRASEGELEVTRIDAAPASAREVTTAQLDDDPAAEIVAWDHPRLVVIDTNAEGAFEALTRIELGPGELGPRRHVLADVDGDATPELVLLGVSAIDGVRSLELVVVPSAERGVVDVGDRRDVIDAPLLLRVPLPDAQAP